MWKKLFLFCIDTFIGSSRRTFWIIYILHNFDNLFFYNCSTNSISNYSLCLQKLFVVNRNIVLSYLRNIVSQRQLMQQLPQFNRSLKVRRSKIRCCRNSKSFEECNHIFKMSLWCKCLNIVPLTLELFTTHTTKYF